MDDRDRLRQWVENWKTLGPQLEAIRREEIRKQDTVTALASLEDAYNHGAHKEPPRSSSGMVEMQRLFAKLRR